MTLHACQIGFTDPYPLSPNLPIEDYIRTKGRQPFCSYVSIQADITVISLLQRTQGYYLTGCQLLIIVAALGCLWLQIQDKNRQVYGGWQSPVLGTG